MERAYNQANIQNVIEDYLEERQHSLAWLQQLDAPNRDASFVAPWDAPRRGFDDCVDGT
ncbi:MAG UNVERIFIED_CONTAM: hypothetical protein LVT10_01880 [Anaerolineae bacterium]